ncbi:hypothetical protein OCH239_18195 [Roseivivax halodurans JCM 10272]|uniref:Gamma-glutamylcyclotransferase AIG2-like domain-containing protein n=1 Tax=Roseivivax halodurans JCM 10272 TaxID=1449350 RepID=X7EGH8_9RHOB|nr:gamma-glutamylcyclotransferase family protein [Roseivivax halodurans]ETX15209.1 hypothetical protein OCH239_18195 [Roseivivax halodurans JCM 10272]
MTFDFFFGYGSLVNTQTHTNRPNHPASLSGWRRAWRALPNRSVSFLTAVPDAESEIDGLVAAVAPEEWDALHAREAFYDKHDATPLLRHAAGDKARIAVFAVPETTSTRPTREVPVLLSYLDVVLQGYLHVFGPEGAERFIETTDGWDAPILNDRGAPRYPRAQHLTDAETAWVDDALARRGIAPFAA